MAHRPIDLATATDVQPGPIVVRPSLGEMVRDDDRRETLEPRVMEGLVALASTRGLAPAT